MCCALVAIHRQALARKSEQIHKPSGSGIVVSDQDRVHNVSDAGRIVKPDMQVRWKTVFETAAELSISTRRVRQMLAEGQLEGARTSAGDWLIDPRVVAASKVIARKPGRPAAPRTSWAIIAELGDYEIDVDAQTRRRVREQIRKLGADDLVRIVMRRSPVHRFSPIGEGFDREVRRVALRTGRSAMSLLGPSLRDRVDLFDGYVGKDDLAHVSKFLMPDYGGTVTLFETPSDILFGATESVLKLPITVAFDLAALATATRERSLALHYIERRRDRWLKQNVN